ncbi:MAG TPA: retropepsin-like aspartic protease [Burkholderiaceae bacterium]|nr:retropepsin-like aspartic protease [Burkholderiaceae bacterium]
MQRASIRAARAAWLASALTLVAVAQAQTVSMSGSLGDKALLVIDGTPRTVATGSTVQGVKLIRVSGQEAVVEVGGQRRTLALGGQVNVGGADAPGGGSTIVLSADAAGHFWAQGTINGKSVRLLVDTGATNVAMSQSEADRLGIAYRDAQRGLSNTANGQVVSYRVPLTSVQVGDVAVYNVAASIVPVTMDYVLLGNSFLTRFQMKRENDTLTLVKRY